MSFIKPFKGIRPKPELAQSIAALPYDVLSSEEAREAVKGNRYSFLHVDKAEIDLSPDTYIYDDSVYAKAAENLRGLIAEGALIRDLEECFYIYELTAFGRTQTGLVVCSPVDEYINGRIKKHELTREDKEKDRIRHVDELNANTGPIFLAYRGRDEINSFIREYKAAGKPVYDFETSEGARQRVWIVNKAEDVKSLKALFEAVPALYIADGHHRNASAVKVALKRREEKPDYDGTEEFNFYLSVLFPADELKILAYNRLLKDLNGMSAEELLKKLGESFEVGKGAKEAYNPENAHEFGLYTGGLWYPLRAKEGLVDESDPIASLDVSILQEHVITPLFGIEDVRSSKRIDFVGGIRGLGELEKRVDSGEMAAAFSMYPTSMEQLMNVADMEKIMPPKSTWFEPKLQSGLFIHSLEG